MQTHPSVAQWRQYELCAFICATFSSLQRLKEKQDILQDDSDVLQAQQLKQNSLNNIKFSCYCGIEG